MTKRTYTSREHWLQDAIDTTRDFIKAERAENAYDLTYAAPDSSDYARAFDSEACLQLAGTTLAALEAEIAEVLRRRDLRSPR